MNVSTVDHSSLECSSQPCKDCTLKKRGGRGPKTLISHYSLMDGESGAVSPLVTALLAVPLVSPPCCNVRPGYPRGGAALLGHHRSDNRGPHLNCLTEP